LIDNTTASDAPTLSEAAAEDILPEAPGGGFGEGGGIGGGGIIDQATKIYFAFAAAGKGAMLGA
jgi:hypothetical protein